MATRPHRSRIVALVLATGLPLAVSTVAILYTIPPSTRRGLPAATLLPIAVVLSAALAVTLGRSIAAYCDELQRARIQAERVADLHKDVLASVSHDVQSPLSAANGYLQLLQARIAAAPELPARDVRMQLTQTQRAVNRVQHITEELIDAARLERGLELTLRLQTLDLVELIHDCVVLEPLAVQQRTSVKCRSADLWMLGDPDRIARVISNVLSNAAKYSPPRSQIEIVLRRTNNTEGEWIELTIRDHGIGIPSDDLPHVFEPFRRGSNVAPGYPGTGLGLAGARSVVLQHGGRIRIESHQSVGTAVHICFPAGVSPATSAADKDRSLPLAG